MFLPIYQPKAWQRGVQKLAALRFFSIILSHTLHRIDPIVLDITDGKYTATSWMTGLPVVWLTAKGARTGQIRTIPLVGIPQIERIVLIATKFGSKRNPAWYYNLKANPIASIRSDGTQIQCRATELAGMEYEQAWQAAIRMYPGYANYASRAGDRNIPILALTPCSLETGSISLERIS